MSHGKCAPKIDARDHCTKNVLIYFKEYGLKLLLVQINMN